MLLLVVVDTVCVDVVGVGGGLGAVVCVVTACVCGVLRGDSVVVLVAAKSLSVVCHSEPKLIVIYVVK